MNWIIDGEDIKQQKIGRYSERALQRTSLKYFNDTETVAQLFSKL